MKVIELFAGIGGFRLALENAGHEVIWSNEILDKPRSIYEYQFKDKPDPRDIRSIQPAEVPDGDLLCGGFPCATFSIAGKRTGFHEEDTRGSLFFEICRILRDKRTPFFLLENVKGLLNHDNGKTFGVIITCLDELGYDVQWELLNSKNFGVPQNRERIFISGSLRGKRRPKIFPLSKTGGKNNGENQNEQGKRQGFFSNISPTLDAHYIKGGASRPYVVNDGGKARIAMRAHTKANMVDNDRLSDYVWTIDTSPQNKMAIEYPENTGLRRLTPVECERLQGLPDNFTKYYADGSLVPDGERWERCGRTITIPVVEEIGRKFYEHENS